jgi:S-adenosyl-L-methionine hydrolase (adenosine-forming)
MPGPAPIVTLTTDFGLSDHYVAAMKAAILRYCPTAVLVDIAHQVPRHDILCASFLLERAVASFDPGAIHLAVVDPGVGTQRKLLITRIRSQLIVCPDNGLITWPWRRCGPGTAHELTWRPPKYSTTFHGRDILAPAAGKLAAGDELSSLSEPMHNPLLLPICPARDLKDGRIIHIDHFGNATTNIGRELLSENQVVHVGAKTVGRILRTYADVELHQPLALIGSSDLLEIAVRESSAARSLSLKVGDEVAVR